VKRPRHVHLTRRESQIMEIVHRRQRAAIEDIRAELPDAPSPSSVRKLLEIMIERGLLRREYDGPLAAVHDLHDLAFATGQMDVAWSFHDGSAACANFFAQREYIRLYGGCQLMFLGSGVCSATALARSVRFWHRRAADRIAARAQGDNHTHDMNCLLQTLNFAFALL
jgi:predicted transcriptional regulator